MNTKVALALEGVYAPIVLPARIVLGPGPEYDGRYSYYENRQGHRDYDTVYWIPWQGGTRHRCDLLHELGHVLDHKCLSDEQRKKLSERWGFPHRPWFAGEMKNQNVNAVEETFADNFARCGIYRFQYVWLRAFLYRVTPKELRR